MNPVGISGFSAYVPPYRISLNDWCDWTEGSWEKTKDVVGHSFRMRGHHQNVYTMAANAALRLIKNYNIDPRDIGYFALGTESSTDNSAGAVIVKGLLDLGLRENGLPPISRHCEVPEFKHACLGGVYAMKGAARYLACEGKNAKAIVVCSDVAEYARGSSGEPTQGAGAVAMLMEPNPALMEIDLHKVGSSSDYRGPDFRKPFIRFAQQKATTNGHLRDFPVFNGKYSTTCYIDEMLSSLDDMFGKNSENSAKYMRELAGVFLHRPYTRMAEMGWTISYIYSLAKGNFEDQAELKEYCAASRVNFHDLVDELTSRKHLFKLVEDRNIDKTVFALSMRVMRVLKRFDAYTENVVQKMRFGWEQMKDVGNLYTAALPAWIAAGMEHAANSNVELSGQNILTLGYGSGDAAEAIPMKVVPGWQKNAKRIGFEEAFSSAVNLSQSQYESLHDGGQPVNLPLDLDDEFVIKGVGKSSEAGFEEDGIEYYRYIPSKSAATQKEVADYLHTEKTRKAQAAKPQLVD